MSKYCAGCETATELVDIPVVNCKNKITQIQRPFFVRQGEVEEDTADPANNLPASTVGSTMEEVAFWAALIAETGDAKLVTAPLFDGSVGIEAGTDVTFGGDGTARNGETLNMFTTPNTLSATYFWLDKDEVHAIRKLECEKDIGVFLVNMQGKILAWEDRDATGALTGIRKPIPISALSLGGKSNTDFTAPDANILTFQIPADYDEHLVFITPSDFNALTFNT